MARQIKWTEEEDSRLIAIISENAGNISQAFRLFAEEYPHRSFSAAQFRWYGVLRHRNGINVCMLTIDRKHKHVNSKIVSSQTNTNKLKRGVWDRVLDLIFGRR